MNRTVTLWLAAACAAVLVGFGAKVDAGTVNYDTSLAFPGVYFGSGNPNGGFAVSTDNGIEIGLRAKYRNNPDVIHTSTDLYSVVPGAQTLETSGNNGANAARAAWNYDFSINWQSSPYYLQLIQDKSTLKVTDLDTGVSTTVNPFSYPDNATTINPVWGNVVGVQNSENPVFGGFAPGYNMNAAHTYKIDLNVIDNDGALLASDSIRVSVVPVPKAAWSGLALLGCVGGVSGIKRLR